MKKRMIDGVEVAMSSGNVFADVNLPDADKLKIRRFPGGARGGHSHAFLARYARMLIIQGLHLSINIFLEIFSKVLSSTADSYFGRVRALAGGYYDHIIVPD